MSFPEILDTGTLRLRPAIVCFKFGVINQQQKFDISLTVVGIGVEHSVGGRPVFESQPGGVELCTIPKFLIPYLFFCPRLLAPPLVSSSMSSLSASLDLSSCYFFEHIGDRKI